MLGWSQCVECQQPTKPLRCSNRFTESRRDVASISKDLAGATELNVSRITHYRCCFAWQRAEQIIKQLNRQGMIRPIILINHTERQPSCRNLLRSEQKSWPLFNLFQDVDSPKLSITVQMTEKSEALIRALFGFMGLKTSPALCKSGFTRD